MPPATIHHLTIAPLIIPLRRRIQHAASDRGVSDPVIVRVELTSGAVGFGETLPRAYVTGETVETVVTALRDVFAPALLSFRPGSFPEALEAIESLSWRDERQHGVPAARAAVELALLDAVMRHFQRSVEDVVGWMGSPGLGSPGSLGRVRFSGVLAASNTASTLRQLRWMYLGGLRAFKLKVGLDDDLEKLTQVTRFLQRPIAAGRASLRVDANGSWTLNEAAKWLERTVNFPICAIEQPLSRGYEDSLPDLHRLTSVPIVHDESLVTQEDAQRLIDLGVADGFNIRISKCGGMLASLRLAALAERHKVRIQLGCMVGETSLLSAAALRFLQVCPHVEWAEGCFGTYLLAHDLTKRSVRFGYGGKAPRLREPGMSVSVDPSRLDAAAERPPIVINL